MWEHDRLMLKQFRECYDSMLADLRAGEEVDLTSRCKEETEALTAYTITMMNKYKERNPYSVQEKKNRFYRPKIPFFQDL